MTDNIKNKTLKMLRRELLDCDDDQPIRKTLIKKLIAKKEHELRLKKKTNQLVSVVPNKVHDDHSNTINKARKPENKHEIIFSDCSDNEEDDTLGKLIQINENNDPDNSYFNSPYDEKFKTEIEKDFTNNKLMDRMNSELDFRLKGKQEKIFDKPYSNINNNFMSTASNPEINNFVTVRDFSKTTPNNDFTNKRILGQRKIISK